MKALVSPNDFIRYISGWNGDECIISDIPNGQRIAEVVENEFEVSSPLFWVDCNSSVTAMDYYYNTVTSSIELIVNVEKPE